MAWESADLKPMSKKLELVKLTLCGPSDVAKEIDIAKKVIDDWNRLNAEARGLTVKHQHWLSDTYPNASERAQGNVNKLIIDEAQILVAVFWRRIGTPTGEGESGTVEEIRRGIKEFANWPTIPQLYVNGEFIGGSDIMREMYQSGELQTMLAPK